MAVVTNPSSHLQANGETLDSLVHFTRIHVGAAQVVVRSRNIILQRKHKKVKEAVTSSIININALKILCYLYILCRYSTRCHFK